MIVTVERVKSNTNATLSIIRIDNDFFCFGLEDEYREIKVVAETRIPEGNYMLKLRTHGGFHERYKRKFTSFHQGMLEIADVPGFTDILIHVGNKEKDTAGCLLVGCGAMACDELIVQSSVTAYKKLYKHLVDEVKKENVAIYIIDNDRHI